MTSVDGAKKRKVEIEDLYRIKLISEPRISPDGKTAAYVQTHLRKKKNDYASHLWLVPTDGSTAPRQLTNGPARDMSPHWSDDGMQIAFISTRSGKAQIWVIRVDGGEARQVTNVKHGISEIDWSPDGRWIAFVSGTDTEEEKKAQEEKRKRGGEVAEGSEGREPGSMSEEGMAAIITPPVAWEEDIDFDDAGEDEDEERRKDVHAKVFTRFHYKQDGKGLLERRSHLFLVPVGGGKARQLTNGDWDAETPRWSPDGSRLAFRANVEPDAEYKNIQDIFVIPVDADGKPGSPQRITGHNAAIESIEWLPDGRGFVALAHSRVDEIAIATNRQVWTISLDGEVRKLTEGFDRHAGTEITSDLRSGAGEVRPRVSADGEHVYFLALVAGTVHICSVPLQGGEVRSVVAGDRNILNFDLSGNSLACIAGTETDPNELYACDADGGHERQLTQVNDQLLSQLELARATRFVLDRPGGVQVEGWYLKPDDFQEGAQYPMVLEIHGGPHTAYGYSYMHEYQLLAARGYVVLYTNPRGSQGYGQAFSEAIRSDWGGIDHEDLKACVDYLLSLGFVDVERLGVSGGSYGGYMTGWIIGHEQRFKAAVASRMVSNLYSAWGSGDGTWMLWSWELEGMPQERTNLYLERSPITYVHDIHTPLLITHAEDDHRCSIEQAEQMYMALHSLGREVKMVRFPAGGHDISRTGKPSLRTERLQHILDWLDAHLKS